MGALLSSAAVASAQLVTYPNGAVAPAKTPEVQAAEVAHFAAKGAVPAVAPFFGYNGYNGYYPGYAGAYPYGAGYLGYNGYPYAGALVAHPNGAVVPADTPAQVVAKNEHFAAKGAIPAVAPFYGNNGYNGYYPGYAGAYAYGAGYAPYAYGYPGVYAAGYHGLVPHPNGALVPVEPADVVKARKEHLAAYASA